MEREYDQRKGRDDQECFLNIWRHPVAYVVLFVANQNLIRMLSRNYNY